MMNYLNQISEVNATNFKLKYHYVFEGFDNLIERYSLTNDYEEDGEN